MDTVRFVVYIKAEDIYSDIAKNVVTSFGTSNYKLSRPLHKGKIKKVIGLIKRELGGKLMGEFDALRPKTFSYLTDDNNGNKKNVQIKFEDYKHCLKATQPGNKIK